MIASVASFLVLAALTPACEDDPEDEAPQGIALRDWGERAPAAGSDADADAGID